ncbi:MULTISPECIES: acyl-ACP--UDP-N-acetylglucosamine O-acyltransferase [Burkholderia]|jgi:UDP-N-acetylglucosamine acyltransferase|uniref:Acyl-[acyl-carrier-protein]--UDP-N-acetylglucosamine O-acyltransferase n=2 Tax=Burkholderia gladioli TaxID=28095 RepID=A0AAP1Y046_BURGA|nr:MULTISPECIES: acyl-ACP--UDP-N-acetylglucosamine O-acyltransferase [Burkholderia]AEA61176.1 UDP-N-acetylglucosamine acyltransferase [Burkholderia gladioli BSR3]AJW97402.1 acyl-[acyl-carrier-protein]-UDP-N-acetylglucosamine O-acyltransferase [Burkholderia gladioli]ASD79726.1 acyl-[acyl-carrier-protein]--UDP-N-acetylglucosamine O-acyltransferase [Burkholderia gladioli pv. gladioli]AWY55030.1 acyl-[acyl-carrier-protein]--UDP-N-acetylglucosamine O-acyltransferase [Burkholderia gladioli pv. gladio
MSRIHSTAVIEPGAQIDESVEIGPYAIVGPHVTIGARTTIGSHSVIEGHTTIGEDNRIGHYASVGGRPQDMKYKDEPTRLVIGDRNTIREFTTIHTGTVQDAGVTTLGDDNWIMAYVHIGHDCRVGNHVILSSNAQMAGHVEIGDWAIVGGMSGVHQFVRIGAHSMLGGASALVQDVPPFVISAGNKAVPHGINVEGLRRRGFSAEAISVLRSAYRVVYKSGKTLDEAKAELREMVEAGAQDGKGGDGVTELEQFLAFIDASQRGIIR